MSVIRKIFKYLEPLWTGEDEKISLRACLAIAFSIDFIRSLSHAIVQWSSDRSLEGLSLTLGIEAGLIVSLLGLTAWSNMTAKKIDVASALPSDTVIKVEKAETVTTGVSTNGKTDKRQTDTTTTTTNTEPIYTPPPGDA